MLSSSLSILNQKKNFEPMPIWEITSMSPSKTWQIYLQMFSPSPIPFELISSFYFSFPKSLKSFGLSSWEMPIPLSFTYTCINLVVPLQMISHPTSIVPPVLVNFKALLKRFRVTCCILYASISTLTSLFLLLNSLFSITLILLLLACISCICTISPRASLTFVT